ncbi:21644_t:CDS:1, partial [Cetraspora pellucida]
NESWNEPYLDPSVFYIKGKYEAIFQKQISTNILDKLATKAEDYI